MDLFEKKAREIMARQAPLADRLRPRSLDEFYGQEHIVGPGRLLRRAIEADQLASLIFYGPPGTGKTTLAQIIANTTKAHFQTLNAVLAGVKNVRQAIKDAQQRRELSQKRTILFVDEVHRWNKAQQDALLPWVEKGVIILVGATTENPYFEVIKALVSRSRIFQLKPLEKRHLYEIAHRALRDEENGYGERKIDLDEEALDHLVDMAEGDGRTLLNALELAVETTPSDEEGMIRIGLEVAEESIQRRAVLYDKEGDVHYDTISAFIKSLRGSDPDAALYWMAKMIYGGEDPKFIFRRMVIFAAEDVGLADPQAIQVVTSCLQAFEFVGMPEGRFHLSQAALYLATAPKSNTTLSFFDALDSVQKEGDGEVPNHLKDSNRDGRGFGHGAGYLYPHSYRDHWVEQQYLPSSLKGRVFYQPSRQGYEKKIATQVQRRRELQLAAMVEGENQAPPEILTFTGERARRQRERWLARTVSGKSQELGRIREWLMEESQIERHHLVLNLNAASGFLLWEALRRAPEGGVWALVYEEEERRTLAEQIEALPTLDRPHLWQGSPEEILQLRLDSDHPDLSFDSILGWNPLLKEERRPEILAHLHSLLLPGGRLVLAQVIPHDTPRLYELADLSSLPEDLVNRTVEGEEEIYQNKEDPLVNWNESDWKNWLAPLQWDKVEVTIREERRKMYFSSDLIEKWFASDTQRDRPNYRQRLQSRLDEGEIKEVQKAYARSLKNRQLPWKTKIVCISARRRES